MRISGSHERRMLLVMRKERCRHNYHEFLGKQTFTPARREEKNIPLSDPLTKTGKQEERTGQHDLVLARRSE